MAKDKLNPLKTKHDIEIELDEVPYKLTFRPVNKQVQEKLNAGRDASKEQYEIIDSKRFELQEYKNLKALNDELLTTFNPDDKKSGGIDLEARIKLLLENKDYVKKISSLEKDIRELDKDLQDINIIVEDYYKQMFDECISGDDKIKFQKAIDDAGLSYSIVHIYINESVRVAQEKK